MAINSSAAEASAKISLHSNTDQPSIFEVIAQESLSTGLSSAFQYLVQTLSSNNPRKYQCLEEWFDELYLIFDVIVQSTHLKAYNSSFAEKFYGLRRVPSNGAGQVESLNEVAFLKSLVALTIAPYFKKKLDAKYSQLRHDLAEYRSRSGEGSINGKTLELLFVDLYPYINFTVESINLLLQVMFTVGRSPYHSLAYKMTSIQLKTFSKPANQTSEEETASKSWQAVKLIARSLGTSLSIGAFFIQFLDYYYTRNSNSTETQFSYPSVQSPPSNSLYHSVKAMKVQGHCPICWDKRTNDTVLSTSGFAFCYTCIRPFVNRNKRCPITGFPSTLEHLVKLYPPQN